MNSSTALKFLGCTAIAVAVMASATPALAAQPNVTVTIKPVHSLVAAVMYGAGEPYLLLPGSVSPHDYALRPSDLRRIRNSDLLVWVGPKLETFLGKLAADIPAAQTMTLQTLPGLRQSEPRRAGLFAKPQATEGDEKHYGDPHIWLSIGNAKIIVQAVADRLGSLDPTEVDRYRRNAEQVNARLDNLDAELVSRLQPVRDIPYVVLHDAYQLFENRYGLSVVGAIAVLPQQRAGAKRLSQIHNALRSGATACIFSEPQIPAKIVATLSADTDVRTGVLDPLGTEIAAGPNAYFELMGGLAGAIVDCLQDN
jgi:zinc transport system substrate-binding protein